MPWKTTPRLEGLFEVNELGQLRDARTGKLMKTAVNAKNGYDYSIVSVNNKPIRLALHRTVCEAFHGPFQKGQEVNHKNFNRQDNRSENLEWLTRSENVKYSYREGNRVWCGNPEKQSASLKQFYKFHPERVQRGGAKLNEQQVREIKQALLSGRRETAAELSRRYGVAHRTIRDIRNGACWSHI